MLRDRQNFMQGINTYVPGMQFSTALNANEGSVFSLGRPIAPGTPTPISIPANASGYLTDPLVFTDSPYGRNIAVAVTLALTGSTLVRVFGEDYLGQPLQEDFVVAGATGKKPFYRILGARGMPGHTTAAATVTVVRGANLSLPYKGAIEWRKENNVFIDFAFAKWVAPDQTDPATATSGDPRGQYIPTASPNGVIEFVVSLRADSAVNANNNGGLHGIKQYAI